MVNQKSGFRKDTSLIGGVNQTSGNVVQFIRDAANTTGADFAYLLQTAEREASLNPSAKAETSSAAGLFQFIDQTWLGALKRHGEAVGLGEVADKISVKGGRYSVSKADESAVLDLRFDPKISSLIAGAHTRDNAQSLYRVLGREPAAGELYIAHFMGRSGAEAFLKAEQAGGEQSAAKLFPEAAKANRSIFYEATGTARSLSDVKQRLMAHHMDLPNRQIHAHTGHANGLSTADHLSALLNKALSQDSIHPEFYKDSEKAVDALQATRARTEMAFDIDVSGLFNDRDSTSHRQPPTDVHNVRDLLMKSFAGAHTSFITPSV